MQGRLSPAPAQSRVPAGQTPLEGREASTGTYQPLVWEPQQRLLLTPFCSTTSLACAPPRISLVLLKTHINQEIPSHAGSEEVQSQKSNRLETSLSDIPISRTIRYSLILVLGQTNTSPYKMQEYHSPQK